MEAGILEEYNKHRYYGKMPVICYAPFKNLYFTQNGDVCVCCNTRSHPVGRYPKQSVQEIWEGEELKILRKHIADNDLNFACELCRTQFENHNFTNAQAIQYDEYEINEKQPVVLEFELDNTCNLECIMCNGLFSSSIRNNREHKTGIPVIHDDKFLKQLDLYLPFIKKAKFLGGEPFLIGIYYKIWDYIIANNPECVMPIQTNATILNERIKALLPKGKFYIGISIDSLEKEVYEGIRVSADFEKVMENIAYYITFSHQHHLFINFSVCPMRTNIRNIPQIIEFCNTNDIHINFNAVSHPPHLSLNYCTSDVLNEYYNFLSSFHFGNNTRIQIHNFNNYSGLLAYIKAREGKMLDYENKLVANAEEYTIENRDKEKLIELLFRKIAAFSGNNNTGLDVEFYTEKLREIFGKLPEKYPLSRILNNIIDNVPVEAITNDLEIETEDVILEKIRAISVEVA